VGSGADEARGSSDSLKDHQSIGHLAARWSGSPETIDRINAAIEDTAQ
jgi:hypothetical protein